MKETYKILNTNTKFANDVFQLIVPRVINLIMWFKCHLVAITFMNISSDLAFIWKAGEPTDDSSDNGLVPSGKQSIAWTDVKDYSAQTNTVFQSSTNAFR